jgi:hypothetical protein
MAIGFKYYNRHNSRAIQAAHGRAAPKIAGQFILDYGCARIPAA